MSKLKRLQNDTGFTLIEIIGVLVILAFLASLAVPRYIDLENNVKQNAIDAVTSEINARENLTWSNHKISNSGFVSDVKIFGELNLNFDSNYTWNSGDPKPSGGTLQFKGESFIFNRTASTYLKPAVWKQN